MEEIFVYWRWVYDRKKAGCDWQFLIGTFKLVAIGTKAAVVCLSLYILNLLFSVTYQLKIFVSGTE